MHPGSWPWMGRTVGSAAGGREDRLIRGGAAVLGFSSNRSVVTFVKRISLPELHATENWPAPQDFLGMICNSSPFCERRDMANSQLLVRMAIAGSFNSPPSEFVLKLPRLYQHSTVRGFKQGNISCSSCARSTRVGEGSLA